MSELTSILKGRDVAFNIFSTVFMDVPDALTDELVIGTAGYLAEMADLSDNADMKKGAEYLREFFSTEDYANADISATRDERSLEYTTLYIIGAGQLPSYESVYLSPDHLTKQEPWSKVKAAYYSNFFRRADDQKTMEDHIALELQFMGLLSKRAAEHAEKEEYDEAEKVLRVQFDFYNEHINKWIPNFCKLTANRKEKLTTAFYPAYALLLKGFLEEDAAFLKGLLD